MEETIKYKIKYSKRKSILISINNEGEVIVTAPENTIKDDIEEIVYEKAKWINSKVDKIKNRIQLPKNKIMFLGEEKEIKIIVQKYLNREFVIEYKDSLMLNIKCEENIEKILKKYLKEQLVKILETKINKYSKYFNIKPKEVKVKEQKKRWGSCSYDNRIFINWKLIMAKDSVLEYVLIHEMCHMVHKNHSKDFYKEVEKILPDFKESEKWLKDYGYLLEISNIKL